MLGIIKGDLRYDYLSEMIESIISDRLEDFYECDKLLLPLGGINSDYSIKQSELNLKDLIKYSSIKTIYTGNANKELKRICEENNIKLIELLKNEDFVIDNAFLTSKGLIHFINNGNVDISNYKILILGYGYIAYSLCKLLRGYNCNFNIFTLNDLEKKYIKLEGYSIVNKICSGYDLVINTIPLNIDCDYNMLKESRVIDIASSPYGFDINKIIENNISYEIISAIPSKYAMKSAAYLIKKYL